MTEFDSSIFGSLTQHHYERTNESWKHLEKQISCYQKANNISVYDMWQLILNYRNSPDDNFFNLEISYSNTPLKPKELRELDKWATPNELEFSSKQIISRYNNVDENTISSIYRLVPSPAMRHHPKFLRTTSARYSASRPRTANRHRRASRRRRP
jgi:hypothetical protein